MKKIKYFIFILICLLGLTGCVLQGTPVEEEVEYQLVQEGFYTFADGTRVDLWQDEWQENYYRLADGTTLVIERGNSSPDRSSVAGQEGFDALTAEVQEKIRAWYAEQGLRYDINRELEHVYAGYLDMQEQGEAFSVCHVNQDIVPISSNDTMMCFLTVVQLPVDIREHIITERHGCTVFNRATGEVIPLSELFNIPEAEICRTLLDRARLNDAAVQAKMEKVFSPEYIIFYPGTLQISYSYGVLEEYGDWIVAVDYEDIKDILQPWAIPYQEE